MKKLLTLLLFALLTAALLAQVGCGGDDDPGTPDPEGCGINIQFPLEGDSFQTGDQVNIRWEEIGTADQVSIDLLKGGSVLGVIDDNDDGGYKAWTASTMGASSGIDFAIRVTAIDEDGCGDTSGEFEILNTEGCAMSFTINFDPDEDPDTPFELNAGDEFEITWVSENTSNSVDIQLLRGDLPDEEPVGFIASGIPDNGSYLWTVDTLHQGTYSFFYLRISDASVEGCRSDSEMFTIIDPDICEIFVTSPQPNQIWTEGSTQAIRFTAVDPNTTHVNINLYQGNVWVNNIGTLVPNTEMEQDHIWVVDSTGRSAGTTFRIKVSDAHDQYCVGWSANFYIPLALPKN